MTLKPLKKVTCSSKYALATSAFDLNNTPSGSFRLNPNSTINANTPKGVLGGMVARVSGDWEAREGIHTAAPLGLFANDSEGYPFENSPAIASGIVPIYQDGGDFLSYLFETNDHETAYASILGSYTPGAKLYCSAFGLLTPQLPSDHGTPGSDDVVAICAKVPTASDLCLGLKLVV